MAFKRVPARFININLPRSALESGHSVKERLQSHLEGLRRRRRETGDQQVEELEDDLEQLLHGSSDTGVRSLLTRADHDVISRRSNRFWTARQKAIASAIGHLKDPEQKTIIRAVADGTVATGVMSAHQADEQIARVHAKFPWLAPASTEVMRHMRRRTAAGPAVAHTPPLIIVGPAGVAKSSWARHLAVGFDLTPIEIDIGATNGATFGLAGVERGWGSAAPGRVVSTMLRERIANPIVIIDELDKVPARISTSSGSLPGAIEVLKSMIEPSTAKSWMCPYYQIAFDMTAVSWIMTTNSIDQIPHPLLDRCKIVHVDYPSPDQLYEAGARLIDIEIIDEDREAARTALFRGLRDRQRAGRQTSLRELGRMIEAIAGVLTRQYQI